MVWEKKVAQSSTLDQTEDSNWTQDLLAGSQKILPIVPTLHTCILAYK